MATGDLDELTEEEPVLEQPEDHREAWLEIAAADVDGGLAALATAARGGRPLPPKS